MGCTNKKSKVKKKKNQPRLSLNLLVLILKSQERKSDCAWVRVVSTPSPTSCGHWIQTWPSLGQLPIQVDRADMFSSFHTIRHIGRADVPTREVWHGDINDFLKATQTPQQGWYNSHPFSSSHCSISHHRYPAFHTN